MDHYHRSPLLTEHAVTEARALDPRTALEFEVIHESVLGDREVALVKLGHKGHGVLLWPNLITLPEKLLLKKGIPAEGALAEATANDEAGDDPSNNCLNQGMVYRRGCVRSAHPLPSSVSSCTVPRQNTGWELLLPPLACECRFVLHQDGWQTGSRSA
jgi:hypothetical protein